MKRKSMIIYQINFKSNIKTYKNIFITTLLLGLIGKLVFYKIIISKFVAQYKKYYYTSSFTLIFIC